MLALALVLAVTHVPGGLAGGQAPRGARLIESPLTFAGGGLLGATRFGRMTLPELESARLTELDKRRSLAPGLVMLPLGAASFIVGLVLMSLAPGSGSAVSLFITGAVLGLVGLSVAIGGLAVLIAAIVTNARVARHLRVIERRIAKLQYGPRQQRHAPLVQPPPPGYDAPPPALPGGFQEYPAPAPQLSPPPLPPQQGLAPVAPSFVVAAF